MYVIALKIKNSIKQLDFENNYLGQKEKNILYLIDKKNRDFKNKIYINNYILLLSLLFEKSI